MEIRLKWMSWGYHYFWTPPLRSFAIHDSEQGGDSRHLWIVAGTDFLPPVVLSSVGPKGSKTGFSCAQTIDSFDIHLFNYFVMDVFRKVLINKIA